MAQTISEQGQRIQELQKENERLKTTHNCIVAEQQIAELEQEVECLKSMPPVPALTGQALHEDLARNRKFIQWLETLKVLVSDLSLGLQDCWDNEYSLEDLQGLQMRVKEVLAEVK